ncbi:hypothetical protein H7U37_04125 [Pseudoflavonifractor phocaeensis]|uniref:hypothetical protein n=1 Tax=Pseudoflavonifractor phocaeensis TaxID=1870988 RepID=UPI00195CAD2D|nr:hypothetical protein [Pseudoflavonifractor phocaeensis]MBM6937721.1 hypothetical protein [Pseudoflavonifractor phocaeensis]
MKRDISDLLDAYRDASVPLDGVTPLSASRIQALVRAKRTVKNAPGKPSGRFARGLLIAAAILSLFCVAAVAIGVTLRDAARADMGISPTAPIPEWTEYDTTQTAQSSPVRLASTLCSGDQLCAYLEVSPIPADMAAVLAKNGSYQYEWDCSIDPRGCT